MGMLEKWHPHEGLSSRPAKRLMLTIKPGVESPELEWSLPASKSHLIRWLLLASQATAGRTTRLCGTANAGDDAVAMRRCLSQLGVRIEDEEDAWIVEGVGKNGFQRPASVLNCQNSGTAFRLLSVACARMSEPVMLDGDHTLRKRGSPTFWQQLQGIGVEVSHGFDEETLPLLLQGPMAGGSIALDVSHTSQHLSALLLSMGAANDSLEIELKGELVSRRHAQLSFDLAAVCGSTNTLDTAAERLTLTPFECSPPDEVMIPRDASHVAFAHLAEMALAMECHVAELPEQADSIGAELLAGLDLSQSCDIDLRDANDLLPPLAACMCLGGGGTISGAAHAQYKESNRISRTAEVLGCFGLEVEMNEDGLSIGGNQVPGRPVEPVLNHGDHRLEMTAILLAAATGGTIIGGNLHRVSDPAFLDRLQAAGLKFQVSRQDV